MQKICSKGVTQGKLRYLRHHYASDIARLPSCLQQPLGNRLFFHIHFSLHPSFLWLVKHNPHIDWTDNKINSWSLDQVPPAPSQSLHLPPIELLYPLNIMIYRFSVQKAFSLPPHRPYDCTIDLLPSTPLLSSQLYNL